MLITTLDMDKVMKAPEYISAYDSELRIILWNPSLEARYGITATEAVGKHLLDLFPAIKDDYRVKCIHTSATEGASYYFPCMPYSNPNEFYSQFIKPFRQDGKVVGAINIVRDHRETERFSVKEFLSFFRKA